MSNISRKAHERSALAQAFQDQLLRESLRDKEAALTIWICHLSVGFAMALAAIAFCLLCFWPAVVFGFQPQFLMVIVVGLIFFISGTEGLLAIVVSENRKLRQDMRELAERVTVLEAQTGVNEISPTFPETQGSPTSGDLQELPSGHV
jgi:hypothetical protein